MGEQWLLKVVLSPFIHPFHISALRTLAAPPSCFPPAHLDPGDHPVRFDARRCLLQRGQWLQPAPRETRLERQSHAAGADIDFDHATVDLLPNL